MDQVTQAIKDSVRAMEMARDYLRDVGTPKASAMSYLLKSRIEQCNHVLAKPEPQTVSSQENGVFTG